MLETWLNVEDLVQCWGPSSMLGTWLNVGDLAQC